MTPLSCSSGQASNLSGLPQKMWTLILYISISSLTASSMYNLQNHGIKVLKSLHVSGAEECNQTCDNVADQDGLRCNWVVIEERRNLCFYLHCLDVQICEGVSVEDVKALQIGQSLPIKIFINRLQKNRTINKRLPRGVTKDRPRKRSASTAVNRATTTTLTPTFTKATTTTVSPTVIKTTTTTASTVTSTATTTASPIITNKPTTTASTVTKTTTTTVSPTVTSTTTTTVSPTATSTATTTVSPTATSTATTTSPAVAKTTTTTGTLAITNKTTATDTKSGEVTSTFTTVNVTLAASNVSSSTSAINTVVTTSPTTNHSSINVTEPTSMILTSSTEHTAQLPTTSLAETDPPVPTVGPAAAAPTTVHQAVMANASSTKPNSHSIPPATLPQTTANQTHAMKTAAPSSTPKLTTKTLMLTGAPTSRSPTPLTQESTTLQKLSDRTQVSSLAPGTMPMPTVAAGTSQPPEIKSRTTLPFNGGKDYTFPSVPAESLIKYLADTSSLIAVLIFGLLFFLVSVLLFAQKAFESYKRKDYVQVDYLINGMYADSEM